MSTALTGSGNGSWWKRFGHIAGRLADLSALRGGAATSNVLSGASFPTTFGTVETDYTQGTALLQVSDGLYGTLAAWQSSQTQTFQALQTLAQNTLRAMVAVDAGAGGLGMSANAPATTLINACTLAYALQTLVTQMTLASASVNASAPAFGAQTAQGSPTGTAIIVGSVKDGRGLTLQYPYAETLTFTCTADSVTGGAAAGNETLAVTGQGLVTDFFSPLWPGGSGVSTSLQAVDGSKNNSAGNKLQNSDFFTNTTANVPDNWTLQIGAASTDVFVDTANSYRTGGGALKFTGTGSNLLDCVTQSFNTTPTTTVGAGGTSYALLPDTVYHGNAWIKCSAVPTAGVLQIRLVDGAAGVGTVFADDQSTSNSKNFDLTSGGLNVGTAYQNVNFAFRTPAVLPATTPYRLEVRLSTAIDSGKSVFVADLSFTPATQLYAGGPFVSVHSGKTNLVGGLAPDTWTAAVTNTAGTIQSWAARLLNVVALGVVLPNSGSPSVADSLVA